MSHYSKPGFTFRRRGVQMPELRPKWSDLSPAPRVKSIAPQPVVEAPRRFFSEKRKREENVETPEQIQRFKTMMEKRAQITKEKSKKKREDEKAERTRKQLSGMSKLVDFFGVTQKSQPINADGGSTSSVLDLNDDIEEVDENEISILSSRVVESPIRSTDGDEDDVVVLSSSSTKMVAPDEVRFDATLQDVTPTSRARACLMNNDDMQIGSMDDLDWPEKEMLLRLLKPFRVGCCCVGKCQNAEHHHETDESPLGVHEFSTNASGAENAGIGDFQCAMPPDPFDSNEFPLFDFLPEAFIDGPKEPGTFPKKRSGIRMTDNAAEFSYASMMMRLRTQYFRELANVRGMYAADCKDVDKRHETTLLVATLSEDHAYAEEIKQARERERVRARNVFHSRVSTLENSMQELVVRTLVQCSDRLTFRLPLKISTKSCLDVIKLPGGAENSDQYYFDLFVQVARGSLDELENEKRNKAMAQQLALDVYHENFSTHSHANGWHEQQLSFPDLDSNTATNNNNSTSFGATGAATSDDDNDEQIANQDKKRKYAPDADDDVDDKKPSLENNRRTEFPCVSQFAMDDAGTACTALAFLVSLRLVSAHLLPVSEELGVSETIFNQLDYPKIVNNGAFIWRQWRNKRFEEAENLDMKLSLEQDAAKRKELEKKLQSLRSTYMLAAEVYESSEYVRKQFDTLNLTSYEASGFWNSKATTAIGESDAPPLEAALREAAKKGVFSAVLTIGGSSMSVAFSDDLWFIFDSHGIDVEGYSTLAQFPTLESVMAVVQFTFRPAQDRDNENEFVRMRLNTYSLYVMHFK
jgi:hypothetical protein